MSGDTSLQQEQHSIARFALKGCRSFYSREHNRAILRPALAPAELCKYWWKNEGLSSSAEGTPVIEDDIGVLHEVHGLHGEQQRVARACAHQVHAAWATPSCKMCSTK